MVNLLKCTFLAGVLTAQDVLALPDFAKKTSLPTSTFSSAPCTSTLFKAESLVVGPTKTEFHHTVTQTAWEDCGGCQDIDVRNLGGLGPVVLFNTTVWEAKTTTTVYACETTW